MQGNHNPAKEYLKRYRWASKRVDALLAAIQDARERATGTVPRIKAVQVEDGKAAYDRMAEDVCIALEAEEQLKEELQRANAILHEVLEAIAAVKDEAQRTVLILRYVNCMDWLSIQNAIGYEQTQTLVLHGRALLEVNHWLDERRPKIDRDEGWLEAMKVRRKTEF